MVCNRAATPTSAIAWRRRWRRWKRPLGEVYNVGGGETANVWEILGKLERIVGRRAVVRREPARPGDQRVTAADTTKLLRHLGWQPRVGLDEGLARQVEWQQGHVQRQAA